LIWPDLDEHQRRYRASSSRRVFSRIVANLPLINSITGPPVNLAITPDQHLALVANSLDWVKDGEDWKGIPDNKIFVIDLTASPPVQIATVEAGKQPSGMAINKAGTLALVANRADDSVSMLWIDGKNVKPEARCRCLLSRRPRWQRTSGAACCHRNHPRQHARTRRQSLSRELLVHDGQSRHVGRR
jgi:hypothetical protein